MARIDDEMDEIKNAATRELAERIVDGVTHGHAKAERTYEDWIAAISAFRERWGVTSCGRHTAGDRYHGD